MPSDHIDVTEYFGPYAGRFTTAEDIPAVLQHLKDKDKLEQQSKRDAVYMRKESIIGQQVADGYCFVIERLPANDKEREDLGVDRKLVAITMAYPLGIDDDGVHRPIPINSYNGHRPERRLTWEIGSSFYNKPVDLPNPEDLSPRGGFYDILVGASVLNLFARAEEAQADAIVANVQSRLTPIIKRLIGSPLSWDIIGSPSKELETVTLGTTQGNDTDGTDANFTKYYKQFFIPTSDTFPTAARFLLDVYKREQVSYDRGNIRNTVNVTLSLPPDLVALLPIMAKRGPFFKRMADTGLIELRKQIGRALPPEEALEGAASHNGGGGGGLAPFATAAQSIARDRHRQYNPMDLSGRKRYQRPTTPSPLLTASR